MNPLIGKMIRWLISNENNLELQPQSGVVAPYFVLIAKYFHSIIILRKNVNLTKAVTTDYCLDLSK